MYEIVLAVLAVGIGFALALTDSGKGRQIWRELRETGRVRWERLQTLYYTGAVSVYIIVKGFFRAFEFHRYPPGSPQRILNHLLGPLLIVLLAAPTVREAVRTRRETGRVQNKKTLVLYVGIFALMVLSELFFY